MDGIVTSLYGKVAKSLAPVWIARAFKNHFERPS